MHHQHQTLLAAALEEVPGALLGPHHHSPQAPTWLGLALIKICEAFIAYVATEGSGGLGKQLRRLGRQLSLDGLGQQHLGMAAQVLNVGVHVVAGVGAHGGHVVARESGD